MEALLFQGTLDFLDAIVPDLLLILIIRMISLRFEELQLDIKSHI